MSSRFGNAAPVCGCGLYAGNKSGPRARFAGKYAVYGQIITSGAMMRVEFLILNSLSQAQSAQSQADPKAHKASIYENTIIQHPV